MKPNSAHTFPFHVKGIMTDTKTRIVLNISLWDLEIIQIIDDPQEIIKYIKRVIII